jgi:superfamily II DNA/RNA helicase
MPTKPIRTDRAPKNRWSAAERATAGQAARHRDGQQSRTLTLPAPLHVPTPDAESRGFAELGVPANLVAALGADGIDKPFPIQAATIPDALAGRDVLGRGRTGSGKTLAFGLPMISRFAGSSPPTSLPRGLVLVPTRELAMQVADVLAPLARIARLSLVLVAGGMPYAPQILAFSRGVDIVVATPGRLIDLMDQRIVDLSRIEVTVLDEADHMADLGFLPAVSQILDTVPERGQRLLFSATLDNAIDRLVRKYLHEPVAHEVDTGQASVPLMSHHLVSIAPQHKAAVTAEIASRPGRTLIFVRTQRGADRVAEQLRRSGVLAGALHGGLAQGARTRIMSAFKHGSLPVLVATDVAARGIHVDDVGLVLHADPPTGPKEYLHRAGRTARAGGTGSVVAFALPHQRRELGRLTMQAGVRPVMLAAIPGDSALAAATGARRASGSAISDADFQRVVAPPPARRSNSARGRRGDSGARRPGRSSRRRSPASTAARGSRSRRVS